MEKKFEGYLLVNWKTGNIKVVKKNRAHKDFYWIPIKFEINVKMPDQKEIVAKGSIVMPDIQAQMIVEDQI